MEQSLATYEVLAAHYLAALRAGDRTTALVLCREALAAAIPLADLYEEVLRPALYKVGQLWTSGRLDVADEHLITAITRSVMDQCASLVLPIPTGPPTIIATCVGPELHDLGVRMVADGLELSGWPTLYLGGNIPLEAIVAMAVRHQVAAVAISMTMGSHARDVRDLVDALRQSLVGAQVKILVGGQPFQRIPELWQQVGADGTAPDVHAAIRWVQTHVPPIGGQP
ncbi:MAG: hypothetical protein HGA45_09725 [Chloroflexales bacterium]|nr:hypothetical protein [Chloroflexales bacterium]